MILGVPGEGARKVLPFTAEAKRPWSILQLPPGDEEAWIIGVG